MQHLRRWLAVLLVLVLATARSSSADDNAEVIEPRTNDELAIAWWEWATSEPVEANPVVDTTGEHCARNQPVDVW